MAGVCYYTPRSHIAMDDMVVSGYDLDDWRVAVPTYVMYTCVRRIPDYSPAGPTYAAGPEGTYSGSSRLKRTTGINITRLSFVSRSVRR